VNTELRKNIGEELAAPTEDYATHYAVLRRGAQKNFGVDLGNVQPGESMAYFLSRMESALTLDCPGFVSGVLYGLESAATPEFVMTTTWAEHLASLKNVQFSGDLALFFEIHRDEIEAGHERRLLEAVAKHIQDHQYSKFQLGFTVALA
jgi:hypothetical protein